MKKHHTKPVQFCLIIDNFRVEYMGKKHVEHLKQILEQQYKVLTDWSGTKYVRLTLDWDYGKREVHLAIQGYVQKSLTWFKHPQPQKPQHQLYSMLPQNISRKENWMNQKTQTLILKRKETKFIQEVTGTFLFKPGPLTAQCAQPLVQLHQN